MRGVHTEDVLPRSLDRAALAPADELAAGGVAGDAEGDAATLDVGEALAALEKRLDQRFADAEGRHRKLVEDVARARRLASRDGSEGGEEPTPTRDGAAPDPGVLWKLSKINAKLPESAQAKIDQLVEAGDIDRALLVAETLQELTPPETAGDSASGRGETSRRAPSRGYGATPAPRTATSVSLPTTRAEWFRLKTSDRAGFDKAQKAAMADPTYTMPTV